jgi:hypothetical protein
MDFSCDLSLDARKPRMAARICEEIERCVWDAVFAPKLAQWIQDAFQESL